MRQQFNPENLEIWLQYYTDQSDQSGYGFVGFQGMPYQRGAGLGSFFRSLFRMAVPLIKSAANRVGRQALTAGTHIAGDMLEGRSALESLEEHGKHGAAALLNEMSENLQKGRGLGSRPKSIKAGDKDVFQKKQNRK